MKAWPSILILGALVACGAAHARTAECLGCGALASNAPRCSSVRSPQRDHRSLDTLRYATRQAAEAQSAALYQKALSLFEQQQLEAALTAVEETLKLNPRFVPALALKARLALAAERYDVAMACLQRAVELEPSNPSHHFLLGFTRYVENDFKGALPALEQARRLKANDARTHFYLALTYEALGRADEASASYEQALKLETNNQARADTLVAYARLQFTAGRYDASEKLIDRALAADAQARDAQYEKGRLRLERGDAVAAIAHGKRALELPSVGTTERQIHFLLARAYTKAGQPAQAEFHLAKFRATPPSLRR